MPLTTTQIQSMADEAIAGTFKDDILSGGDRISSFTDWELLPAAAVAAGTDKLTFLNTGVNPGAVARATKGGIAYPTLIAPNDAAVLTGVSGTSFRPPITATNKVVFMARVSVPIITSLIVSAGLGQAPSATDPGAANAGTDSAEFIFDPTGALATGLGTASRNNWLCRYRNASGTVTYLDSGIAVVAAKDYILAIGFNAERQPVFFIDRTPIGLGTVGGSVTSGTVLITQIAVKTLTNAARSFEARFHKVGRDCA